MAEIANIYEREVALARMDDADLVKRILQLVPAGEEVDDLLREAFQRFAPHAFLAAQMWASDDPSDPEQTPERRKKDLDALVCEITDRLGDRLYAYHESRQQEATDDA